jgi:acyl-CoA thioesterase-1
MSIVANHFASGTAFFSGSAFLVTGIVLANFIQRRILPAIGRLVILMGLLLIWLSATPLPIWAWCVWGMAFVYWVVVRATRAAGTFGVPSATDEFPPDQVVSTLHATDKSGRGTRGTRVVPATIAIVACTLAAVSWELSWQVPLGGVYETRSPAGKASPRERLVVIGDSLSAEDFTEGGDPWPTLVARDHDVEVLNLSFSGAKAGSAAKRLPSAELDRDVVLLEIGGNDLLGATTPADFEQNLDLLLAKVCARPVLAAMLELPLPPLYNRYGEIQRRLARRYDVVLIPKRRFASVLMGEQATLDGLHLSPAGHRKMAEMVWEQVSPFLKGT